MFIILANKNLLTKQAKANLKRPSHTLSLLLLFSLYLVDKSAGAYLNLVLSVDEIGVTRQTKLPGKRICFDH
jgi:hypothetical protein